VDFEERIFFEAWWIVVFTGVFAKSGAQNVVFWW
jgi:hypothetical protein